MTQNTKKEKPSNRLFLTQCAFYTYPKFADGPRSLGSFIVFDLGDRQGWKFMLRFASSRKKATHALVPRLPGAKEGESNGMILRSLSDKNGRLEIFADNLHLSRACYVELRFIVPFEIKFPLPAVA